MQGACRDPRGSNLHQSFIPMIEMSQFVTAITVLWMECCPLLPLCRCTSHLLRLLDRHPRWQQPQGALQAFICCCLYIYAIWSLFPWVFLLVNEITFALPSPLLMFSFPCSPFPTQVKTWFQNRRMKLKRCQKHSLWTERAQCLTQVRT